MSAALQADCNILHTAVKLLDLKLSGVYRHSGDGLIFIDPVEDVICLRTNERSKEARSYEGDIDTRQKNGVKSFLHSTQFIHLGYAACE